QWFSSKKTQPKPIPRNVIAGTTVRIPRYRRSAVSDQEREHRAGNEGDSPNQVQIDPGFSKQGQTQLPVDEPGYQAGDGQVPRRMNEGGYEPGQRRRHRVYSRVDAVGGRQGSA